MKSIAAVVLLCLFTWFSACSVSEEVPEPNARVLGARMDCGWLIQFHEPPNHLPESETNTYIMVNSSSAYQLQDQEVFVEARSITTEEALICTSMGIAYPQIFVEKMEY